MGWQEAIIFRSNMRFHLITFFVLLASLCHAQQSVGFGLKQYTVQHPSLGAVRYFVTENGFGNTKPVLLYLEGSGCNPFFRVVDDGQNCCLYIKYHHLDLDSLSRFYHVILVGKPGTPLADTVRVKSYDAYSHRSVACSNTYNQLLSMEWRAQAASLALSHALRQIRYTPQKVIVMGNSEGGQVAPRVAVLNKKITHCINLCGSGVNQFYSFVVQTRMKARKGEISYEAAEQEIDTLLSVYRNIYGAGQTSDKQWLGASYKRWSSFTRHHPLDSYLKLKIPIYMTIGARDENGEVLNNDYVQLEFLRLGKTNLTYKVYPNADHQFNELVTEGAETKKVPRIQEVVQAALRWADTH
jgi:pimeloyl-ACP methyl ester carboxylesterase